MKERASPDRQFGKASDNRAPQIISNSGSQQLCVSFITLYGSSLSTRNGVCLHTSMETSMSVFLSLFSMISLPP